MTEERYEIVGRRLAITYISCLVGAIVLFVAQLAIVDLIRPKVLLSDIVAVLLFGPPLVAVAYGPVKRGFREIRHLALTGDANDRHRAIELALDLPRHASRIYIVVWVIAFTSGVLLSQAVNGLTDSELVGHALTFAGLLFVVSFPLYAVVEHALRPVLRDLFSRLAGEVRLDDLRIHQVRIPIRVAMSLSQLAVATTIFLGARWIAEGLGVEVAHYDELRIMLLEVPLLGAITVMAGWAISASVGGSIDELSDEIRLVASGDLTRRTAITTTDELGALMADVDRMVRSQAGLIRSAAEVSRELSSSAADVAQGSDEATHGVGEIAHAMQDVVIGAQSQFEQIAVARDAADSLAAAIEQTTAATVQATEVSDNALALADDGSRSAAQARGAMEHMRQTIEQAITAVDRLGGDTSDIGEIVETIALIADQTNLLALNAAIEAARAGESGRGFAVVAEEVRQLAGQSNEAAEQIAALIQQILGTVGNTVEAVNRGGRKVDEGVTVVDAAGEKFGEIAGSLGTIGKRVTAIDDRTAEVVEATHVVSEAIDQILSVTESVAALAQQTSANTEEASAASEQIASSADSLRATAKELETKIATFRV